VLLSGPAGTGKRQLADWMARHRLGLETADAVALDTPDSEHADLRRVGIPDDKQTIGIDPIRSLIADLALTSYAGHGKVAIIEPADRMTRAAANSLLKTLEEPPGDALIILIVDRDGKLPATILSRCQQIRVNAPELDEALAWLEKLRPGRQWETALPAAGGSPMKALELEDQLDTLSEMDSALQSVASGRESPIAVASAWSKMDVDFVLSWLQSVVQDRIRVSQGGEKWATRRGLGHSESQRMDSKNLFCYLDIINRHRAAARGSFNAQLLFERLLIDWSTGLTRVAGSGDRDGMKYIRTPSQ